MTNPILQVLLETYWDSEAPILEYFSRTPLCSTNRQVRHFEIINYSNRQNLRTLDECAPAELADFMRLSYIAEITDKLGFNQEQLQGPIRLQPSEHEHRYTFTGDRRVFFSVDTHGLAIGIQISTPKDDAAYEGLETVTRSFLETLGFNEIPDPRAPPF